ncbi:MAG: glycosyltransferase family 2 protein [Chloroflexi bacterium]|nr:glycosyltransferase family 2 protein [Chloroflexota bacterium]
MTVLSIVTTLYNSAAYVQEFHRRCAQQAAAITADYEIIFVNDGSPDASLEVALSIYQNDPKTKVVNLSRNFGHHKAIMTGLLYAQGELVFLIDSDLEEAPELLGQFYAALHEHQVDVVYGIQKARQQPLLNRVSGNLFYQGFNFFSDVKLRQNLLTVRLMTKRYAQALLEYRERVMIIAVLWEMAGFKQLGLEVEKQYKGWSNYNLARKVSIILHGITATSKKPLLYIAYLGGILTFSAALFIAYLILMFVFRGVGVEGWLSTMVSIWCFSGLNILILGIIAIYLSVIFDEVKQRPYTIVKDYHQHEETPPAP